MVPHVKVPAPTAKVELTLAEGEFIVTAPAPAPTFKVIPLLIEIPLAVAAEFKVNVLQAAPAVTFIV